ncbi:probable BOI-related E3 ubiquitin-protein ligase 3 [Vigna umbellata]|uniref:probable BOI-related E3 ubiquitin-protein ligase 3 n=2 Tax=Vigna umbellata TaxID=87088 RepID=UPI001F5FCA29|nr:probable BOI-related E3 ubiquitin-protein ligase 3 [Vigna umbellata]
MAVEARHFNILHPQQLIPNRETLTNPMDATIMNMYATQTGLGLGNYSMLPLSGTTTASETFFPPPHFSSLLQKPAVLESDNSTLSYNNKVVPVSRKRSRDSIHDNNFPFHPYPQKKTDSFSFLGEDISSHIHRQQLDLDALVSQHMEKVRMELEEKRKRQARRLMESIEVEMAKRLRAKEEEILKIEKLNWVLEEKVRSLSIENQFWRDLAQTNEATANVLRTNLEQVLAQVSAPPHTADEDAESCCGSSDEGWRTLATGAQDKEKEGCSEIKENIIIVNNNNNKNNYNDNGKSGGKRLCRKCGEKESCVLILPCRHLCVCTGCGSSLDSCPVCKSIKNASVHVNMTL